MLKAIAIGVAAGVLLLVQPGTAAKQVVHKRDLPVVVEDGISWYTTGVGADTRQVIVKGFPLKLIFATLKGELLANVQVDLAKKDKPMCTVKSSGPWLFIDAPAGTYNVRAQVNGKVAVRKNIRVPAKGINILTVHFR